MSLNEELAEIQRKWNPPVELLSSGPRDIRLSSAGIVIAGLAVLMFVGAIAAAVGLSRLAAREDMERQTLRKAGVEVPAVVTRHWHTGGKDDTPKIAYEFRYDGRTYHGSSQAPRVIWRRLVVGSPITVRVVPSSPELNHPADWERETMPRFLPGMIAASLVLPGLLIAFIIRREMALLSDGRPAPARVTNCRRVKNGHRVKYEFPTLNGVVIQGRGEARRAQPVGATICVLYDRDNPNRNAPYPLKLVRVDR